jgi:hypothetical protein
VQGSSQERCLGKPWEQREGWLTPEGTLEEGQLRNFHQGATQELNFLESEEDS